MRGLGLLEAGLHDKGRRDGRVDLAGAAAEVGGIEQATRGHGHEIRIAEVFGAIGEHALLDLGDEVHVLGRVQRYVTNTGRILLHGQHLQQCDSPELGGGAVITRKPRQPPTSGSRHTAR